MKLKYFYSFVSICILIVFFQNCSNFESSSIFVAQQEAEELSSEPIDIIAPPEKPPIEEEPVVEEVPEEDPDKEEPVVEVPEVEPDPENENIHYLKIPSHNISEGSFNKEVWEKITNFKFLYSVNPGLKSVVNYHDKWWLQLRHKRSSAGTERIIMNSEIPRSTKGYRLKQTLMFKAGWSSGGTKQSGKLGFSLAGGTSQSGGKIGTDGWSVRPSWTRDEIRFYLYYANRPYLVAGNNPAYGHTLLTKTKFVPEKEYEITFEVLLNSPNKTDGIFRGYVNGKLEASLDNVLWMTGKEPEVDKLWLSSFHGGNSAAWSPPKDVHILVRDVSLEEL